MARISEFDVRAILDYDEDEESTMNFIKVASSLVDRVCLDSGYGDEVLKQIETWLAAHFVAIKHQRPDSQSVRSVSESYQYKVDLNLNATMYGQQAMLLDTDGNLAALNRKMDGDIFTGKLTASWIGTEDGDEYND